VPASVSEVRPSSPAAARVAGRAVVRRVVVALVVFAPASSTLGAAAASPLSPAGDGRPLPRDRLRRAGARVPPSDAVPPPDSGPASFVATDGSSVAPSAAPRSPWVPVRAPPPPPRRRRRRGRDPVDVRSDPVDDPLSAAAAGPSPVTAVAGASLVISLKSSSFPFRAGRQGPDAGGTERREAGTVPVAGASGLWFDRRSGSPAVWAPARPRVDSHGNTSLRLAAPCGAPDPFQRTAGCLPYHLAAWLHAAAGDLGRSRVPSPGASTNPAYRRGVDTPRIPTTGPTSSEPPGPARSAPAVPRLQARRASTLNSRPMPMKSAIRALPP
jgi:hypothetical protein